MKTPKTLASLGAALTLATLGLGWSAAAAQEQSTFDVPLMAGTCFNCHGSEGRSPGSIPSLAGRPEAVLRGMLLAYHSGNLPPNTTVMGRIASGYTEEELTALASYFAELSAQPSPAQGSN